MSVQKFNHDEFGEIRVVEIEGEEWFDPKGPAEALGYARVRNALERVDPEDKKIVSSDVFAGRAASRVERRTPAYQMNVINESGMFELILGSEKPDAKRFRRWITKEVLPAIIRTGQYQVAPKPQSELERAREYVRALEELENARPKVLIHDRTMEVDGGWYVATVGRMFDYTPHKFHELMRLIGATYRTDAGTTAASDFWVQRGWLVRRGVQTPVVTPAGLAALEARLGRPALDS